MFILDNKKTPDHVPVTGMAIIDTGATVTCIDNGYAEKAGLAVVDQGHISSATHVNEQTNIYACAIEVVGGGVFKTSKAMGVNLAGQDLAPDRPMVALIGRDALQQCVMIYDGIKGRVTLSIP